jgi:hypothetical protein
MEYVALIGVLSQALDKLLSLIRTFQEVKKVEEAGGVVPDELIEKQRALRKQVEDLVKAMP